MKSNLTLALVGAALISLPAAAQTTAPANTAPKVATGAAASPMYEMKAGQWRATKLAGIYVYNANNEKIGDISELIVDRDGKVEAVVIGVGGFLGMGEHLAAVPFSQVKWVDHPRDATVGARSTTTTTGSGTSATTTESPSAGTDRPATTTMADRTATRDAYRGYPDHAEVDMTKDQLKALPEVKYVR